MSWAGIQHAHPCLSGGNRDDRGDTSLLRRVPVDCILQASVQDGICSGPCLSTGLMASLFGLVLSHIRDSLALFLTLLLCIGFEMVDRHRLQLSISSFSFPVFSLSQTYPFLLFRCGVANLEPFQSLNAPSSSLPAPFCDYWGRGPGIRPAQYPRFKHVWHVCGVFRPQYLIFD